MQKPFSLVSGEGLGLINTTHRLLTDIGIDSESFGHAPVETYANINTGNLVVQTPPIKMADPVGVLSFYFTYNSQAATKDKWHLNWDKKIIGANPQSDSFQLVEADGHITTFTKDPNRGNQYFSQNVGEGTPFIRYEEDKQRFRKYDPKSELLEYYDTNGRLIAIADLKGLTANLNYDNQGRLQSIDTPSGKSYVFNWQSTGLTLSSNDNGKVTDLRYYGFDSNNQLIKETYPKSSYALTYDYSQDGTQLRRISQTDQTQIDFNYDSNNRVNVLQYGVSNRNTLTYKDANNVILEDNDKSQTQFALNDAGLIANIKLPTGYVGVDPQTNFETLQFEYKNNCLSTKITANGAHTHYTYDDVYNLKIAEQGPENQLQTWFYQPGGDLPLLLSHAEYVDNNNPLTTRYIYDPNFNNNGNTALRYVIASSGSVNELIYDAKSVLTKSERHYLKDLFDLKDYVDPKAMPSYDALVAFTAKADLSATHLTDYTRNKNGQILFQKIYSEVDKKGEGVKTDTMSNDEFDWDDNGNQLLHVEQQTANTQATTRSTFDDLNRKLLTIDPIERKLQWNYQDQQQQVLKTCADGKTELTTWDKQGNRTEEVSTALIGTDKQTRNIAHRRDHNGLERITIPPTLHVKEENLPRLHQFYDRQYRHGFSIARGGSVKETRIDVAHRIVREIAYGETVDIKNLYLNWPPLPSELPSVKKLKAQLPKNPTDQDAEKITLHSLTGKPHFFLCRSFLFFI